MNRKTAETRLKMEQTTEASTMTDRPVARQMQRMPQTKIKTKTHAQTNVPTTNATLYAKDAQKVEKIACGDWKIMTANSQLFPAFGVANLHRYYLSPMHSSINIHICIETYIHKYICELLISNGGN